MLGNNLVPRHKVSSSLKLNWSLPPAWLGFLIVILLALGIFFRFVNLDRKFYWSDETVTLLRVSGYTETELVQHLPDSRVFGIEQIQKYQRLNPESSVIDTIKSLAAEDPQHPPLYYSTARFWAQWFGTSEAAMRSLPALISLLAFPCVYWLCLELFGSSITGWVAVALVAVSPFHLVYAQEARQYSLWIVLTLLSSAALLRARRVKTKVSWAVYAVTLVASFYTYLLSLLVAIGHGIYVVALERFQFSKTVKAYLAALSLSIVAFIPWLLVVITNRSQANSTTAMIGNEKLSLIKLCLRWLYNITLGFFDINVVQSTPRAYLLAFKFYEFLVVVLLGYAFYLLCRNTPKQVWLFIVTLSGVTALALILPDLVLGRSRSSEVRLAVACYLSVQLAIAYLLATKLTGISTKVWQQKLWQFGLMILVSGGVFSCATNSQTQAWWNKVRSNYVLESARIVNQSTSPLLIGSLPAFEAMSFSHRLDSKVKLLVKPKCDNCHINTQPASQLTIPKIPDGFSDVFLLKTGWFDQWLTEINKEQLYKLEPIHSQQSGEILLWRLIK